MEAPIIPPPIEAAPIVAPAPAPIVPIPITPIPVVSTTPTFEEGGITDKKYLGLKLEYVVLFVISLMATSYTMSILYYRKNIKTSNTITSLQNQIDQLKAKAQEPKTT